MSNLLNFVFFPVPIVLKLRQRAIFRFLNFPDSTAALYNYE